MDKLVLFNNKSLKQLLNKRIGESKFGEHAITLKNVSNIYEQLKNLDVKYVIFGLPEDVGVFANYGKSGTSNAWSITLKYLLNIQSNQFINPKDVLILGHLDFENEQKLVSTLNQSKKKDIQKARKIVSEIDGYVSHLVYQIIKAGKKPIIIGGGHNNSYGNIKGASLALNKQINVVNFDAHTDFRVEEGRHSGNGFSYAYNEGFLKNYFVFGLHENYNSNAVLNYIDKIKTIAYNTFESIEIRKELKLKSEMNRGLEYVSDNSFGIEIDCDAIEDIPSSAMTPSGFCTTQTRRFVNFFGKHENALYLHICEAVPTKKTETKIGKLITYLITDFIKAHDI
ncbi:formimidoylglutamase [Yeosuana sp. MJ-SS3]|uniref:Formimidoylglutamase n=1 Tax=Gilvirhabdus luticola TaxID=3079858 RepID=A0ABU3U7Y6_9FLAO|nr:formimidoylglutamase [Yeosuana sp. MJ-SS3]MDU8886200.1 formimidoylglutamase [Yeosuana sp. MJ-SS3]